MASDSGVQMLQNRFSQLAAAVMSSAGWSQAFLPSAIRGRGKLPAGRRVSGYSLHQDLVPTMLGLMGVRPRKKIDFDGTSLLPMVAGKRASNSSDFYITECTWMRKHGWRTPEWKLIVALEPDFHFKPEVELYNLIEDPLELKNVANKEKGITAALRERLDNWVARREKETGRTNPMNTNLKWHGTAHEGAFTSAQQAYDTLHIGSVGAANRLQAGGKRKSAAKKKAVGKK